MQTGGRAVTPFQEKVYQATRSIPRGRVASYAWVADEIGCRSSRAVGQALRRNPFAPEVPCHRVLNVAGELNGFNGRTDGEELVRKRRLLEAEGVRFSCSGKVLPEYWHGV
jgi:methylated-DNA-[protein]-cysteine S-methyltransferase